MTISYKQNITFSAFQRGESRYHRQFGLDGIKRVLIKE
jgi:hypothetical protein